MGDIGRILKKIILSYKKIPDKKPYIEFFSAILTVPVLVTVILININHLKPKSESKTPEPTPQITTQTIFLPVVKEKDAQSTQSEKYTVPTVSADTTSAPCRAEIGNIMISSPPENGITDHDPVNIIIDYDKGNYCSVVWSYRINKNNWSDFDDKSIALYNLPQGDITLDLKIKSIVNGNEKIITRNFTNNASAGIATPTIIIPGLETTQISTNSAN